MDTLFKLSFFLYKSKKMVDGKCPIYLKIRNQDGMFYISTKISVEEKLWDGTKNLIKGLSKDVVSKNETLNTILASARNSIARFSLTEEKISLKKLKNELTGVNKRTNTILSLFDEVLKTIKKLLDKDYTPSTLNKYQLTYDRIGEYIRVKYRLHDLPLNDLDYKFISEFEQFLKIKYNNKQGTVYKHCQRLIKVTRLAVANNLIRKHPFADYKVTLPPKNVTYLTKDDLDKIVNKQFATERLNNIKMAFVFCCYTGLAYTEVRTLMLKHIVNENDGEKWIVMTRKKTKKAYRVPLLPQALSILSLYENHQCRNSGKALPILSNVKFNEYLKEVADICEINLRLTTHVARKTFAVTILLSNGVSIPVVASLLNHSSIEVTMSTYSAIIPTQVIQEFKALKKTIEAGTTPNQV